MSRTLSPRDPGSYADELFARTNPARVNEGLPVVASSCAQEVGARRRREVHPDRRRAR